MKRVLSWAVAGLCIAGAWTGYFFGTAPRYEIAVATAAPHQTPLSHQLLRIVMMITYPAILSGMTFPWIIPLNGVIYAIVGFAGGILQGRGERRFSN